MSRDRWIALGAVLVVLPAACAFPTFGYAPASGGTSSGGASTSTSSSTVGGGGGTGGEGGKLCHALQDAVECGANERCTVADVDQGTLRCTPISATPMVPREHCSNDDACPAGTFCDRRTAVCMPLCNGAASCAGKCVPAESPTVTIPGVTVCTAHCKPTDPMACGPGAMCAYDPSALDFDCFFHAGKAAGAPCSFINECPPTYVCAGTCSKWCHPADDFGVECGGYCSPFANATFTYDGVDYGYCP